jgi:hypothetical protein
MSASRDDGTDSELSKYAAKWSREQPATPDAQRSRYVSTSASKLRLLKEEQPPRPLWPEPVPEPRAREDGLLTLIGRSVKVAAFAALVALLVIFGKPLLQRLAVLEPDSASAPTQVSRAPDRLTANDAPANRARVPPPRLQRPLPRRRPQLRRHNRHRSRQRRGSKRRSLRSRNRRRAPFAG